MTADLIFVYCLFLNVTYQEIVSVLCERDLWSLVACKNLAAYLYRGCVFVSISLP